ncbi:MAG: PIN domain-containing protein [Gammaproteobacteria bacterium]|nr:PIN domain-containing protein [Gammaproteobacteria bacterium]
MRVFLDTRVLIAALATRGICADLLRLVLLEHQLLASKAVFRELRGLLIDRLGLPRALADQVVPFLRERAEVCETRLPAVRTSPESEYDHILGAALAVQADVLVTGDRALLAIDDQASVRITDPRGFWQLMVTARMTR